MHRCVDPLRASRAFAERPFCARVDGAQGGCVGKVHLMILKVGQFEGFYGVR